MVRHEEERTIKRDRVVRGGTHDEPRPLRLESGATGWARVPAVDALSSFPKVGVDAALCKVTEEREEVLSARARGAMGGGLPEKGGLKDRDWKEKRKKSLCLTAATLKRGSTVRVSSVCICIEKFTPTKSEIGFPGGSFGREEGRGGGGGGTGLPRD